MKNILLILSIIVTITANSQVTWTQKANFSGTARWSAIGASIGTKGYIGMGRDISGRKNDFWEWDQATNTWTQKANFTGLGREGAIGFSIGNKVYIGTGYDGNVYKNDLWEWNQTTNVWVQKTNIPIGRAEGVGFSIGTKGYMCTGSTPSSPGGSNDFWEWDQTTNTWTQKTNIPAPITFLASGFSIGQKGYVLIDSNNFWEWDQVTDTWTQKTNIGTTNIDRAIDFSVNNKGYIGGVGQNEDEFWEYSPLTNTWSRLQDIPNGSRGISTGFSIANLAYVGTGYGPPLKNDFWESNPSNLCVYPTVNTQPVNQSVSLYNNAMFSLTSTGSNQNYQWQTDLGSGFQNISNTGQYSGTTTNSLTISNVTTLNNNQIFRCLISSSLCPVPSNTVLLNVLCIPLITSQPINQSVSSGNNAQFFVQPLNSNLSFQWQTNFGVGYQNISNAGQYNGATNDTLNVLNVSLSNNNQLFRCLVSSGTCTDTSSVASLSVTLNNNINELSNDNSFIIYPNPANDFITIKLNSNSIKSIYTITDLLGKIVLKGQLNSETTVIQIGELNIGVYFIQVGEQYKKSFKVIKK